MMTFFQRRYVIGGQTAILPLSHRLPRFQRHHRLYDRFLPVLCKQLSQFDSYIVDVGANVGDTALAIAQTCDNPILCIEGDPAFYALLKVNKAQFGDRIRSVKCLVGTGNINGSLVSTGSTAKLSRSEPTSPASALDDVLQTQGIDPSNISLIKVDTDGYDADVLQSAAKTLEKGSPILFWENEIQDNLTAANFETLYEKLSDQNYKYLWVLDNFGNLMLEECTFKNIVDLNRYILAQYKRQSTRTIWYTDILACTDKHVKVTREAIGNYKVVISPRSQ